MCPLAPPSRLRRPPAPPPAPSLPPSKTLRRAVALSAELKVRRVDDAALLAFLYAKLGYLAGQKKTDRLRTCGLIRGFSFKVFVVKE